MILTVSRETLKNGQLVELTVDSYTSDGEGVGRVDGAVVFVPRAIEGEPLRVRIVNVGKTAAHGEIVEILQPSPHRITPDCPLFGSCGGCDFRHMDYAAELALKSRRVLDALTRIGGFSLKTVPITGAAVQDGYRNKVQYPVGAGKRGAVCGFYKARSHEIVSVPTCKLQPECADRIRSALLRWMRDRHVSAYDEKTHSGVIRHLYLRVGKQSGEVLCCVVANCKNLPNKQPLVEYLTAAAPEITAIVASYNEKRGNVVLGSRFETLYGADAISDTLCGLRFSLSPQAFYQVNHDQAEILYEKAVALAAPDGTQTVLDLYCGAGTISLCLAERAKQVYGVEIVESAVADAKKNAAQNGVKNAEFFCADASAAAKKFAQNGTKLNVIVVDPPRKGLSPDVVEAMRAMAPQRIVYVSCDPATLARDLKLLCEGGYALKSVEAVDMFPRCAHVETVTLIVRAGV